MDYNGDERSDQPGNCEIRQVLIVNGKESPFAAEYWLSYAELNKSRKFLFNLLLCLEVSRRKIEDPERFSMFEKDDGTKLKIPRFKNIYCNLPILGTIVIDLELMNDQIIGMEEFFVTTGKYCCFSGNDRENHIKIILKTFYKLIVTIKIFKP